MEFRLLGPLEASRAGTTLPLGGPKQRTVLTHLLLRPNQVVPTERLIDEVWGEDAPDAVRSSLQSYVSHLRKALGAERVEGRRHGYVLHVEPDEIDALCFERLVSQAREVADSDPAAAVTLYTEALALWRGNVLDDLSQQPSLRPDIARLEALRTAAVEEKIAAELQLGRAAALIPELETLTARNPLSERLWGHLMVALYRSGRQADALAAFRRARQILDDELGIEPSPELQRLHEQVLRQEAGLEATGTPLRGYRLLEQLGEGAFGVVHRAFQPQINREVAIKAVHPDLANDAEFIRRFEVEAQMVARLEHPHIVPLYDYWREPDAAYLVMRLLRGGSLRDVLDRGALPVATALKVLDQVSLALALAHRHDVIHRDVKPSNILFDDDGNAYLTDFGIATDLALAHGSTRGRTPPGVAYYLSPEELDGREPTSRTDIYSLGVVAYEMLAGRHPLAERPSHEPGAEQGPRSLPQLAPRMPEIPAAVDEVLARATAADPDARYDDPIVLATALRDALAFTPSRLAAATDARNPYRGLHAFQEVDSADFFGREALVASLLQQLWDPGTAGRFVAVVGASGSGKSSVVHAGLVPALRKGILPGAERWFVVDMVPTRQPFAELHAALRRVAARPMPPNLADRVQHGAPDSLATAAQWILADDTSELLLIVDQFEELFTLVEDEGVRARFAAALVRAVEDPRSRVRIVTTMRADFYDRPLRYPGLAEIVAAGTQAVTPLTAEELERAVVGPADRVGVDVDRGLVAQIVAEVAGQPGGLPLLQYALTELFERRSGDTLDVPTYLQIGGVAGALARRAELIFSELPPGPQRATRQLFLRLVTPGLGTGDTRRRVPRDELLSLQETAEDMAQAIDVLGSARLLSFDRDPDTRAPTVEVAHEALLREWHRVRSWIDESREHLRMQRWLSAAALEWIEAARDDSFLVTGSRLDQLEAWQRDGQLATTPDERAFIAASVAQRDRHLREETVREIRERALERRSYRRLRTLVMVLTVAALVAGGLTVYAVNQGQDAQRQARLATARELAAAATASLNTDAERSLLLALEAVERTKTLDGTVLPEAEEALHRAMAASRAVLTVPGLGGLVDWSPEGNVFVTEGPEESGLIDIRDARTGNSVRSWKGHDVDVNGVAFSSDGSVLATTGDDGALRVWDWRTGEEVVAREGVGEVWGPAFSENGRRVSAAWIDEGVRVLDVPSGETVGEIPPPSNGATFSTALNYDGSRVAVGNGGTPRVEVRDVDSGNLLFPLLGHTSFSTFDVDWSPNSRWIATTGHDQTARVWDAETGELRFTLRGHTGGLISGDWSPDSTRLVTGSEDGTARVWAVAEDGGHEILALTAYDASGGLGGVAFSHDGERILTGDASINAARIWDVSATGDAEWANLSGPEDEPLAADFGASNDELMMTRTGADLAVWNVKEQERARTVHAHNGPILEVDVSPDGNLVAVAGGPGIGAWDASTGEQVFYELMSRELDARDVSWNADGTRLAIVGRRPGVRVLDRNGTLVGSIPGEPDYNTFAARFSPDGRHLAVSSFGIGRNSGMENVPHVMIYDWIDGTKGPTVQAVAYGMAFDDTGKRLVTADLRGVPTMWDVETGEPLARLRGHSGPVFDVAFSPDGTRIATAGADGTVRLWDPDAADQPVVLRGHTGPVSTVRFSNDGSRLVSGADDGIARVWAVDIEDLMGLARGELTRSFTDEECQQFLHAPCG